MNSFKRNMYLKIWWKNSFSEFLIGFGSLGSLYENVRKNYNFKKTSQMTFIGVFNRIIKRKSCGH